MNKWIIEVQDENEHGAPCGVWTGLTAADLGWAEDGDELAYFSTQDNALDAAEEEFEALGADAQGMWWRVVEVIE